MNKITEPIEFTKELTEFLNDESRSRVITYIKSGECDELIQSNKLFGEIHHENFQKDSLVSHFGNTINRYNSIKEKKLRIKKVELTSDDKIIVTFDLLYHHECIMHDHYKLFARTSRVYNEDTHSIEFKLTAIDALV